MYTSIIIVHSIQPPHHEHDSYIIVALGSDRIIKHNNHGTANLNYHWIINSTLTESHVLPR